MTRFSEAVESLALAACESVESADGEHASIDQHIPDLLAPVSHSGVTLATVYLLLI